MYYKESAGTIINKGRIIATSKVSEIGRISIELAEDVAPYEFYEMLGDEEHDQAKSNKQKALDLLDEHIKQIKDLYVFTTKFEDRARQKELLVQLVLRKTDILMTD